MFLFLKKKKSVGSKNLYFLRVVASCGSEWALGKYTSKQKAMRVCVCVCVCVYKICVFLPFNRPDCSV